MPKPARPATGRRKASGATKLHPLNMRTTAEIRTRLEQAAATSGRSLAQEVEHRLSRTFEEADTLARAMNDALGGPTTSAVLQHLAAIAIEAERTSGHRHWLMHDDVFDKVIAAWKLHLDQIERPSAKTAFDIRDDATVLEIKLLMIGSDPEQTINDARFSMDRYSSPTREKLAGLIAAAEARLKAGGKPWATLKRDAKK